MGSIFDAFTDGVDSGYKAYNPYANQYLDNVINQQGQLYSDQMSLAKALQQQMAGQGPNPAQTQYLGNTQANIANTQGLIASQRGLNPALAARMGANAAAKANQDSALGSALLQQQQQLGATSNLGNLYGQMQQGNLGYQNLYNTGNAQSQNINAQTASENKQRNAALIGTTINAAAGAASKAATSGKFDGGRIQGTANTYGDSPSNDTVHAMLSPGEIVIPRSKATDADKAKAFIDHLMKTEKKEKVDYTDVLKARRKK